MTVAIEYIDAAGAVTRTVHAPADEAESGIQPGEVSYRIIDSGPPAVPGDVPSIDRQRQAGRERIDGAAGRARRRYLSVGIGQELTYQAKYADACAYLRALEYDPQPSSAAAWPYVAAEAISTGVSEAAAAERIALLGAIWEAIIGPQIEAARISGKDALATIETAEAIAAHVLSVVATLDQI